jgi:hypothetical protein
MNPHDSQTVDAQKPAVAEVTKLVAAMLANVWQTLWLHSAL